MLSRVDAGNRILDGAADAPMGVALLGECMAHCKASDFVGLRKRVSCAKTVGLILTIFTSFDVFLCKEVPFGDRDKAAPHLQGIIHQNLYFWD